MEVRNTMMKRLFLIMSLMFAMGMLLIACNGDKDDGDEADSQTESATDDDEGESTPDSDEENVKEPSTDGESEKDQSPDDSSENNTLSAYTSEEIEYARVWLQIGPNQEIDALYVTDIPAGEPLNPNDETSAVYPEDVIQLAGTRLVDGSVTYSGNGDGTIRIYKVPLRWDGEYPAGEEFYEDLMDDTNEVYIEPGDDEQVKEMIQLLEIDG